MSQKVKKDYKERVIHRLKIIEGQIVGLRRMIEKEAECEEILKQMASITQALRSTSRLLFERYLRECKSKKILNEDHFEEITECLFKFLK